MPLTVGTFDFAGESRRLLAESNPDGSIGRPTTLRGFNVSGSAKTLGIPCATGPDGDIRSRASQFLPALRDDGFDLLRIPVVWEYLQPDGPDDWRADVASIIRAFVEYAGTLGFWVIIDVHQDVLGSYFRHPKDAEWRGDGLPEWLIRAAYGEGGDPLTPEWKDQILWIRSWPINYKMNGAMRRAMEGLVRPTVLEAFNQLGRRLAALFAGLDNVLTYEVLNEPFSECVNPTGYAALAAAFCAGLGIGPRPSRTPTMSIMPAGDWLNTAPGLFNWFHPQLDEDSEAIAGRSSLPRGELGSRIGPGLWLLTPHFYDPHAGAPDSPAQPARYPAGVAAADRLMAEWQVAPVVGEFGCPSDEAGRDEAHRVWLDEFERRGWSWCHWNFNPDSTGQDGNDHWGGEMYSVAYSVAGGQVQFSPAYRAFLRPFIRKHGGSLRDARWDASTGTFVARIGRAYRAGWRTEIYIPKTLEGFRVSDGCEVAGRTVLVDTDSRELEVTIEVWPD